MRPSPRREASPTVPKYERSLPRSIRPSWQRSRSSSPTPPGTPPGLRFEEAYAFGSDDGETSHSAVDTSRNANKTTKFRGQVTKITLGPLHLAGGFKNYQMEIYTKIIAASKRLSQETLTWIQEIETAELRHLENPKTEAWDDLDNALAEGVMDAAAGPPKKEIIVHQQRMLQQSNPLYGRVALRHVWQKFQIEWGTALPVDYHNLMIL